MIVKLSLSRWYPGSGVVLYCIDSSSLPPFLLSLAVQYICYIPESLPLLCCFYKQAFLSLHLILDIGPDKEFLFA